MEKADDDKECETNYRIRFGERGGRDHTKMYKTQFEIELERDIFEGAIWFLNRSI